MKTQTISTMFKKSVRFVGIISVMLGLIVSCTFLIVAEPANAVMTSESDASKAKQEANTIILEFSGADSDDIDDLRRGGGKIFQRIARTIEMLQAEGKASENVQPIIVITKKKKSRRGLLD